jgi:hypothetical protein
MLETESPGWILRVILTRCTTRMLRNNHEEAIAAYCLTPAGREELRTQQTGDHSP